MNVFGGTTKFQAIFIFFGGRGLPDIPILGGGGLNSRCLVQAYA